MKIEDRRCDGCFQCRPCRWYMGFWLCTSGPARCWRRRRRLRAIDTRNKGKEAEHARATS